MVKKKVTVILYPGDDEGSYVAHIPLFPECTTEGDSVEEAFAMAQESLELALEEPRDIDLECLEFAYAEHIVVGTVEVELPVVPRHDEVSFDRVEMESETAA